MTTSVTTIDGSYGEGGGQILRNACTYAAILGTTVRITNIRAGRKVPGLRPQHLVGLRLLAAASGGSLAEGDREGSTEILFVGSKSEKSDKRQEDIAAKHPSLNVDAINSIGRISDNGCGDDTGAYVGDTQTAGSVCLLMQTVLPFALFRGDSDTYRSSFDDESLRFVLKGGTDADFAPPLDYYRHVFLPTLRKFSVCLHEAKGDEKTRIEEFGRAIDLLLVRRGFFPRGGGEVRLAIRRLSSKQLPLPPIRLTERGIISGITVRAFAVGNCPLSKARTLSATVQKLLRASPRYKAVPLKIELSQESEQPFATNELTTNVIGRGRKRSRSVNSGCGVTIIAETDRGCLFGGSSIGSPKVPLTETARMAYQEIIKAMNGGGCVDDFLQDQLIIYMALADGSSEIVTNSLTPHTQTAIWLASKMLPKVRFEITRLGTSEHVAEKKWMEVATKPESYGEDPNVCDTVKDIPECCRIRCSGIGYRRSLK